LLIHRVISTWGAKMSENDMNNEILERIEKKAHDYEYKYHGCGQCVLQPLLEELDLPGGSTVLKTAGYTGAGIARMQNMCGALMAGVMAMGLVSGREKIEDPVFSGRIDEDSGLPMTLVIVRRFYQKFVDKYGSWICREIQESLLGRSFNLARPEEYEEFERAGGYNTCSKVVGTCARMAGEMILKMRQEMLEKE
jgi:C_GCAxxG_C_C family probable redox protein